MAEIKLKAETGRALGSGAAKRIRAEGRVPGVVYGLDAEPIPVVVDWKPLRAALTTEAGLNALINLDVDGDVALTIIKEMQRHPIRGDVLHLDFLRVNPDAQISVEVPVILEGEATKVLKENGMVDHLLFALTINAKPADIPNELVVDVSEMELHDAIRVGDLVLPAGVSTDADPEEAVAIAMVSSTTLEAEAIAASDAAEAAEQSGVPEGDAPAAEGDAEG